MRAAYKKIASNAIYAVALTAVAFCVWQAASFAVGSQFILPDIRSTFSALGELFVLRSFWIGLGGTMLRCLISYAISVALAGVLYYLCVSYAPVLRIVSPIVSFLRSLPTMAVSLILAIWARTAAPVVLGVLVIMPYVFSALFARNSTVPVELVEICRLCGAGKARAFGAVWLPHAAAAFPEILSGAMSFNIKVVIAAEILMQTAKSIGMLMQLANVYLETATLIALVFVAVVLSVVCELIIKLSLRAALAKYRE